MASGRNHGEHGQPSLRLRCFLGGFSNLGLPQLSSFFPVPASIFQIQSVFVPGYEPSLVRWSLCSNHPAYLRGKLSHCSDPAQLLLPLLQSQANRIVMPRETRKGNEIVTPPLPTLQGQCTLAQVGWVL